MNQCADCGALEDRLAKLELRVAALEKPLKLKAARAEWRRTERCHWVKDPACHRGRYWRPMCMGGAVAGNKSGCTCGAGDWP